MLKVVAEKRTLVGELYRRIDTIISREVQIPPRRETRFHNRLEIAGRNDQARGLEKWCTSEGDLNHLVAFDFDIEGRWWTSSGAVCRPGFHLSGTLATADWLVKMRISLFAILICPTA